MAHVLPSYPFQQLALHEGFDHVVRSGEVPGLVSDMDRLEAGWERVLRKKNTNATLLKKL